MFTSTTACRSSFFAGSRLRLSRLAATICLLAVTGASTQAAPPPAVGGVPSAASPDDRIPGPLGERGPVMEMYTATVDAAGLEALRRDGQDIVRVRAQGDRFEVDLVLWRHRAPELAANGVDLKLSRDARGLTAYESAVEQERAGFNVWKPYDGPGGLQEELESIARDYPQITKLAQVGHSVQGRPILTLKVTKDAATTPDGSRPAVLYQSLQHAREWIGPEVARRFMWHLIKGYGKDAEVTSLVDSRELWFILVLNPDGYQITFEPNYRLWRKTARDNNGDGLFTWATDGVDPNRNFDAFWGYDNEGSDGDPAGWTYRGPGPASEPETQAVQGLLQRVPFVFMVNYHSVAGLLLYGPGWQVDTPVGDDPISEALSGDDAHPAVPGLDPQTSGDLYIVNGDTCDYAIYKAKTLCWTPELTDGGSGGGFVFPDDEALVQKEFEDNLPFALDLAKSAADPTRPISHLGNTVKPMYPDPFALSYGDPQPVQVNAARRLGAVTVKWQVNDGPVQSGPMAEWQGGKRYGVEGDIHFHRMRGEVSGAKVGDRVKVWFEAGMDKSDAFTYTVAADSGNPVLVVAEEERAPVGAPPDQVSGAPEYAGAYLNALAANGIAADVYDVDGRGRQVPSALGVLSHYAAVVWYGGDEPTRPVSVTSGTQISRLSQQLQLEMRDYLNEGGRLMYAGQWAVYPYFEGQSFNPYGDVPCDPSMRCKPLTNDFMQYYLGVGAYSERARPAVVIPNRAGAGGGMWSTGENNQDHRLSQALDLGKARGKVSLSLDASWVLDRGYDFAYVEVSGDGETHWTTLKDEDGKLIDRTPKAETRLWALTGTGSGQLHFDLSAYVGQTVYLQLRTFTDYWWIPEPGWWVDNVVVADEGGRLLAEDFDRGMGNWKNEGWQEVPVTSAAVAAAAVAGGPGLLRGVDFAFGAPEGRQPRHSGALQRSNQGLAAGEFPLWESTVAARYDRPGDAPRTGMYALSSGPGPMIDGYQRITRTLTVPAAPAKTSLSFWTAYDLMKEVHALFVEAHTVGEDDWTTLPDQNGHTGSREALVVPCLWGIPHLSHFMTPITDTLDAGCRPRGTTGEWNAAAGLSDGWEPWSIDLSAYAGKQIEVAISYLSIWDRSLGVMLDDITLSTGQTTSFETDLGGWSLGAPPEGGPTGGSPFARVTREAYPLGAALVMSDTLTLGFGLEGIASADMRRTLMARATTHLLGDRAWSRRLYLPTVGR